MSWAGYSQLYFKAVTGQADSNAQVTMRLHDGVWYETHGRTRGKPKPNQL